ncbi:putative transmembrane protein [Senna tora]|uniref:Putative transmembrane protein n=1 Tax=Senna tora TaxID=362788 RepID=A0A834TWB1_9FABA|nr:putative transmembrane protein [Senna tora]
MDREQEEMQFLGLFGVYKESLKMISSWRKMFTQITLTLILPLSFIFLFHIEVSNLLFRKIRHNTEEMNEFQPDSPQHQKLSDLLSSEWTVFFLFKLFYFTLLLIFSLLSTSAVVYTIASIYTARDVTFTKVMSVVPKVWKRLLVTFLCTFAAFLAYNLMAILLIILWALTLGPTNGGIAFLVIILIFYYAGFVYLTVVWHLASVVTVLEDSYGFKAMMKSKELIKGKMWVAILIFLMLNVSYVLIQVLFKKVVVRGWRLSSFDRTAYGIVCFLLLSFLLLFWLVVQTVLYFVCKSYHHENIDKSALSDHLEVYLGEYEPLKPKDVQLEQYQV